MASILYIDKCGNIEGLADDVLDKLRSLGPKTVKRVSNVEFDYALQCWVATDLDGKVIASHPIRSEVIAAERKHLNKLIEAAFTQITVC
jgi:hypothetical protein